MPITKTTRKPTPKAVKGTPAAKAVKGTKPAGKAAAKLERKHAVPAPTGKAADAPREYEAMLQIILKTVPARGSGVTHDAILEAARAASRRLFPGDTHRMWAKQVLLDLQSKGVVVEDPGTAKWRKA
ncbi:MAG: DUF6958 family protein [Thermoplasmatota archaeon]